MNTRSHRHFFQTIRSSLPTLFFILILFYFLFHYIQGERGLLAYMHLSQTLEQKQQTLAEINTKVAHLEAKVSGLRTNNLDLDLLEGEVRRVLNFAHPSEAIFFLN